MRVILLISCRDQSGIVAGFSGVLFKAGGNILSLEEHTESGRFFMRVYAETLGSQNDWQNLRLKLQKVAARFEADLKAYDQARPARIALLVTNDPACPQELLSRHKIGELNCEIPVMIGNKPDLAELAGMYGVAFEQISYEQGAPAAEQEIIRALQAADVDFVILARFMKVLSPAFVGQFKERIINIHHGFLPAFKGSKPYHQAWEHGVKVIGATAHLVTAGLDEGPIISQEVIPVSHQDSPADMVRAGRDVERRVLLKATAALLEHKIILHDKRTVVFS